MDQDYKYNVADSSVRRQGLSFLVALIFGSIFALLNCIFAFYNLFQIALAVVRKLDGMKKKVNLAEKALKERRLPPDLYARLQDTADTQIETQ
ncbi:hypothetical protein RB195_005020 [Necator americanus]|uniref:Uncharacterized protein n=1 Tax=Necator americanus TaxID=51031 RepID=A0ABR1BNU7_NECAM